MENEQFDSQPGDVSVGTTYCQVQQNTSDPEEPQAFEELQQDPECSNSGETTITVGSHSQTNLLLPLLVTGQCSPMFDNWFTSLLLAHQLL